MGQAHPLGGAQHGLNSTHTHTQIRTDGRSNVVLAGPPKRILSLTGYLNTRYLRVLVLVLATQRLGIGIDSNAACEVARGAHVCVFMMSHMMAVRFGSVGLA